MSSDDLDLILRASRPGADRDLAPIDLDAAFAALLEDLGEDAAPAHRHAPAPRSSMWRRWRLRVALVGGLALIAMAAIAVFGALRSEDDLSAYAAEAIEVAEANRRLLVSEGAWHVNYAAWDSPTMGDVEFITGSSRERSTDYLEISWYPDSERGRYIDFSDRERTAPVEIAGEDVYVQFERRRYREPGSVAFQTTLPASDGTITVIDGTVEGDEDDAVAVLESIESVDTATWLGAMPDSVVQPSDQASEIDRLLEGVPLPAGFDGSVLEPAHLPQDEYQLTAFVMYGAYCGWLDEWWRADQAGDSAAAQEAIEQLNASPQWPAVVAQKDEGALDNDFRMYAKTVEQGYADPKVYDQMMNCIAY